MFTSQESVELRLYFREEMILVVFVEKVLKRVSELKGIQKSAWCNLLNKKRTQ